MDNNTNDANFQRAAFKSCKSLNSWLLNDNCFTDFHSDHRTMVLFSVHGARGGGKGKWGTGGDGVFFNYLFYFFCSRTPRRDTGWSAEGNDVFPSQKETHWQQLQKEELQIQVPRMKMRGRLWLIGKEGWGTEGRCSITFNWKMRR